MSLPTGRGATAPGAPPWRAAAAALSLLLLGFLLLETPPVRALFATVATALAMAAAPLLDLLGYDIVRSGVELRDTISGHAIAVTSACDGSGLLAGLAGAVAWLSVRSPRLRSPLRLVAVPILAILAFNLARILLLFVSIGHPSLLAAQHLYVTPLLSALLVAWLALDARRLRPQDIVRPWLWIGVALAASLAWYGIAHRATCAVVVPLADGLLFPGRLVRDIACADGSALVRTTALLSRNPPAFMETAFFPSDFTLALPLVVASLAGLRLAAAMKGAALALALFSLAMATAALTSAHDAATAAGATVLDSAAFTQAYTAPGELMLALIKAVQNVLVHFNLFLLPLVLLPAPAAKASSPRSSRRRA